MSETNRLISFITLFLAVALPSFALLVLDNKGLARIIFVLVMLTGYGTIGIRWARRRRR